MNAKNLAIVFAPNLYSFQDLDHLHELRISQALTAFMSLLIEERSTSQPFISRPTLQPKPSPGPQECPSDPPPLQRDGSENLKFLEELAARQEQKHAS